MPSKKCTITAVGLWRAIQLAQLWMEQCHYTYIGVGTGHRWHVPPPPSLVPQHPADPSPGCSLRASLLISSAPAMNVGRSASPILYIIYI